MKRTLILLSLLAALSGLSFGVNAAIEDWSTAAGSNNSAAPDGFPEGMAPSAVNNAARETMAQVRRWAEQGVFAKYATESGTTTAYAMTPDIKPSAYTPGALYWFVASTTNTGASTFDVASLGTKNININDRALAGGEIVEGDAVVVVYDGSEFEIVANRQLFSQGDSGATAGANENELVVEDNANAGISILTPNTGEGYLSFGDPEDDNVGSIAYHHNNTPNSMRFNVGAATLVSFYRTAVGGNLYMNETTNSNMNGYGITINQGATSDEAFAIKQTSVAHGVTDITETDTFLRIDSNGANGQPQIEGFADQGFGAGLNVAGYADTVCTSPAATGCSGILQLQGFQYSGTGKTNATANAVIASIQSHIGGVTRSLVHIDEDGDIHVDGSGSLATFDDHDDIALLAGFRGSLMTPENAERFELAQFIEYARPILEKHGIVTYNDDGRHFVSYKGIMSLLIDAVRQQASKQENEIDTLRAEIRELRREIANDNTEVAGWPGAPLAAER